MQPQFRERSVIIVVITLFLALVLVYVIYFRIQGNSLFSNSSKNSPLTQSGSQFVSRDFGNILDDSSDDSVFDATTGSDNLSSLEKKVRTMAIQGIKPRYAKISVADSLGLSYQFAFSDPHDIRYAYLGTGIAVDIANVVRTLGGDTLALATQNDILSNQLRGDRVLFINIPHLTYQEVQGKKERQTVAMIVDLGEDRRFIQASIDKYYAHKQDMKSYFDYLYD